ncbi:MAG: hypothetical protein JO102_01215, partial [Elusimicrobia bacterium]|nr:hypothetical protein [Elusimicrobiota bacterium]
MTASLELTAVLLSLLPAVGNVAGGLIAELTSVSGTKLSLALHAAVGAILALVAVELMPRVIVADPAWPMFLAFFVGGCFALGVDASVERISVMMDPERGRHATGPWMICFANAVDSLSDGIMLGAGSAIHPR